RDAAWYRLARPAGLGELFEPWLAHYVSDDLTAAPGIAVAAARHGGDLSCELRIERRLFANGRPGGFDIRVRARDAAGRDEWLQWGGALHDDSKLPPAAFVID